MTRVLSALLGAREPAFQQGLRRLETASGRQSADIRLTTELERLARIKLKQLGLDPRDTTGEELYAALQERVRRDDERLSRKLRQLYGQKDQPLHIQISEAIKSLPMHTNCFALKTVVGRKLIKKMPPKQTLKLLGYRSLDSMLRREQLLAVFAAAWLLESTTWRKALLDAYKKLKPADFELRPLAIITPSSPHWFKLSEQAVTHRKHNVIALPEFGALILLPLPSLQPPAATMSTLLVALHGLNDIAAASAYLKLAQVRSDFGASVLSVVRGKPTLPAELLDGPVEWPIIQRYYARFGDRFREDLFEPHIQRDDLAWHSVERALSHIDPQLEFWHHTGALGFHTGSQPVSFNATDAALNYCNQLSYKRRMMQHFRNNLWSELLIRYLKHESVEQAVMSSLEMQVGASPTTEEIDYLELQA